jgi:hypothetical protein
VCWRLERSRFRDRRRRLWWIVWHSDLLFDGIEGDIEFVRLAEDCAIAQLVHGFGVRIIRWLLDDSLPLDRLDPISLEDAI